MWNMIHCEVQGRGHEKSNLPCQDKTCVLCDNGVHVIALADGAGSAKLSHYGAECVTYEIANLLCKAFDDFYNSQDGVSVKKQFISYILDKLKSEASEFDCELTDLASTLLMAAVKDDKFILLHLGDGVIGYVKANEVKVASAPDNGEFANTTFFTTSQDALVHLRLFKGELKDISGFVLMSDGTEAALYNKKSNAIVPGVLKIMNLCSTIEPKKVELMLFKSFENVIKKATSDDCSIAIMTKDDGDFKGYNRLSFEEKLQFLNIDTTRSLNTQKLQIKKYDLLLNYLEEPHSLEQISKKIKVKENTALKRLEPLLKLNLITFENNLYQAMVILDKH